MNIGQLRSAVTCLKSTTFSYSKQCHLQYRRRPLEAMSYIVQRNMSQHHQSSLPKLPVPPLEHTLKKYLRSVQPLVTEEEFYVTKDIVDKFGVRNGIGEQLQKVLEERAKSKENWLSDWWLDTAYLHFRWPVVVWSSPGLVFPLQEFKTLEDQLTYAALVIAGAMDYKTLVDEKIVPVETMGGQPLDMSQYLKIFGTCRIPGVTKDSLVYHGLSPGSPKHIVAVHNNHFFKIDVYDQTGKLLNFHQLYHQLRNVVDRSTHQTNPVGLLSTQHRNVWGKNYKILCKDKMNRASIKDIESSLFLLCIDGPIKKSVDCKMTDAALQCIHGNGASNNAGNRWYDKTIQFIIGKKGEVGLTYEHSPAEGPPIANLMDHIVHYMGNIQRETLSHAIELSKPERLMFNINTDLEGELDNAANVLESLVKDLEMTCFVFQGFGKEYIKSHKMSPDSFIQIAIQLAFYRIHKEPGAHYESASTRKFLHGRTETIRSCSMESVKFAKDVLDEHVGNYQKVLSLQEAIQAHKKYVQNAVNGLGVDRHLLGLKLAAIELGMDVPPLFMDVGYIRSSHMRLSTSQVPAKCEAFMCYGPLVPDGYGCCYNPRKDSIVFGTSALNSSPETHSSVFRKALEESLLDMKKILDEDQLRAKL